MAVDLSVKKLQLARNFIAQATALIQTYYACKKFNLEYVKGGISYSTGDFDSQDIKSVDPNDMGTLITRVTDFIAWYESGTAAAAGAATSDILLKVQNGAV